MSLLGFCYLSGGFPVFFFPDRRYLDPIALGLERGILSGTVHRKGESTMRSLLTVFLILSLVFVISCATLKQKEIDPWLNTISGGKSPEVDITGSWRDTKGGFLGYFTWGEGYLYQEQSSIRGVIGDYNIKGIVSGKTVYLVFLYGDRVYFTARLENFKDLLTGNYFGARDKNQKKGYPTSFARIGEQTQSPTAIKGVKPEGIADQDEAWRQKLRERGLLSE